MTVAWKADYAAQTDQGRVRTKNQDVPIVDPERSVFAVSDGIGGIPYGGETAQLAEKMIPPLADELTGRTPEEILLHLRSGIDSVSNAIRDCGNDEDHGVVFGATISGFVVAGNGAAVFNMGDSRVYRLRNGRLQRLTKDHSIVQILLDAGEITPEEAEHHSSRGRITRFLGMMPESMATVLMVDIQPGDRFLVCSDGLHGMVPDRELQRMLSAETSAQAICEDMIRAANEAGGMDNITAVVWIARPVDTDATDIRADVPVVTKR
jgi:protein phosphatase